MIVHCLAENTTVSEVFKAEHGFCVHIATENQTLLFDLGASAIFIENAKRLKLDLTEVDLAVISHGHYDHGGGLKAFLNLNEKAKVCVHQRAFEKHFSNRGENGIINIGLDEKLSESDRIFFIGNQFKLSHSIFLFSDILEREFYPKGNRSMLIDSGNGQYLEDGFLHEQNLIVYEKGKSYLFAGCAHRGIINIVNRASEYIGKMPDVVIAGFHLTSRNKEDLEQPEQIEMLAHALVKTGSRYYTGHCTGLEGYNSLKNIMGDQIMYLSTGQILNL